MALLHQIKLGYCSSGTWVYLSLLACWVGWVSSYNSGLHSFMMISAVCSFCRPSWQKCSGANSAAKNVSVWQWLAKVNVPIWSTFLHRNFCSEQLRTACLTSHWNSWFKHSWWKQLASDRIETPDRNAYGWSWSQHMLFSPESRLSTASEQVSRVKYQQYNEGCKLTLFWHVMFTYYLMTKFGAWDSQMRLTNGFGGCHDDWSLHDWWSGSSKPILMALARPGFWEWEELPVLSVDPDYCGFSNNVMSIWKA